MSIEPGALALVQKPGKPAPSEREELARMLEELELVQELARRDLMDFILYTHPHYKAGWFHHKLAKRIQKFVEDCAAGLNPRLIIEAPPRHGKSDVASRYAPAWAFGAYPDLQVIATSCGAPLASAMNRDVQRVIDSSEYRELFPDTQLYGKNIRTVADGSYLRNSDEFEIVNHEGHYLCAGVGGNIMGRGGQMIIIDDPIKDDEEAHSEVVRQRNWDWFTGTLYHRVENGGGILLIMTRWHKDDLAGRLLEASKNGGEHWDEFKCPAIAEEDEFDDDGVTLLRAKGEALHPERIPLSMLERIKLGTADKAGLGSRVFSALFQQRPSEAGGNYFERDNWQFVQPPRPLAEMETTERKLYFRSLGIELVIQAWDTALGGKKKNDNAACVTLGVAKGRYYIIDLWCEKVKFPAMLDQVQMLYDAWLPNVVAVEGGGSASGKATVQLLSKSTHIPFREVVTTTDKEFRAGACSPTHEAGMCYLFRGNAFNTRLVDHCADFPAIANDDDVDAFMLALEAALGGPTTHEFTEEILAALGAM